MQRFEFTFDYPVAGPLAVFGILPSTSYAEIDGGELHARFGPWSLSTPLANIISTDVTGPYRWYRAVGVRMSLSDRGVTFGSNARAGLLLTFAEPVRALRPGGLGPKNPNATLTVADPKALQTEILRASA